MNISSAEGLDELHISKVKSMDPCTFAKVPVVLKCGRSVLISERVDDSYDLANWRPLTICSTVDRLFSKLVVKRVLQVTLLNCIQRGFSKADGCSRNCFLLWQLVTRATERPATLRIPGLEVAFIDLAKAFDTVLHSLVYAGLRGLGFHAHFITFVERIYEGSTTRFTVSQ